MDALEFAREYNRMCRQFEKCNSECACYGYCTPTYIENIVPLVEKWSAEHPKVRNVDHVAMLLEKAGFEVDKVKIATLICPPKFSEYFGRGVSCKGIECDECRKWWLKEYKGE